MKDKLYHLWLRRPRLGRRGKIVRNLLLALPFLIYLWGEMGYILPTREMDFRRLERACLSPPSELVFLEKEGTNLSWEDGRSIRLHYTEAVGVLEDRAVMAYSTGGLSPLFGLWQYSLAQGKTIIPLETAHLTWFDENGVQDFGASALLAVDIPREAVWGELALDVTYRGTDYHRDCPMFDMGEGRWLVAVEGPDGAHSSGWYLGGTYTMTLWDGSGKVVLEQTGVVPDHI